MLETVLLFDSVAFIILTAFEGRQNFFDYIELHETILQDFVYKLVDVQRYGAYITGTLIVS